MAPQQHQHQAQRQHGNRNQQCDLQLRRGVSKEAEGRAAVFHVGELKQPGDDWTDVMQRNPGLDDGLSDLVQREHRQRNQ